MDHWRFWRRPSYYSYAIGEGKGEKVRCAFVQFEQYHGMKVYCKYIHTWIVPLLVTHFYRFVDCIFTLTKDWSSLANFCRFTVFTNKNGPNSNSFALKSLFSLFFNVLTWVRQWPKKFPFVVINSSSHLLIHTYVFVYEMTHYLRSGTIDLLTCVSTSQICLAELARYYILHTLWWIICHNAASQHSSSVHPHILMQQWKKRSKSDTLLFKMKMMMRWLWPNQFFNVIWASQRHFELSICIIHTHDRVDRLDYLLSIHDQQKFDRRLKQ